MSRAPFWDDRHERVFKSARREAAKLDPIGPASLDEVDAAARKTVGTLGRAGLFRHAVPKRYGGSSEDVEIRNLVAARDGVAYGSGFADALLALQALGSFTITISGSDDQRKQWLPKVAKGSAIAAFAVTEPEAGSDVAAMTTRARATKDGWEISGAKTFISNAGIADFYCLFAKTDPAAGAKGISCFLVPGDARGLSATPMDLMAPHAIGSLKIQKVKVPKSAIIGETGRGYGQALAALDRMRPTVAAAACGFADRALHEAIARAKSRKQFGHPISEFQGLRWKIAQIATELDAARLLVDRAAYLKDNGQERITLEGAMAKYAATEAAQRAADLCLQIHGGTGMIRGGIAERLYREVRALRIYEGTSEVLLEIVGRTTTEKLSP